MIQGGAVQYTLTESLTKVTRGAGIILLGTGIGMGLAFAFRVLLARYLTQSDYGTFTLALVFLNTLSLFSLLGLRDGVTRYIAFYRGKGEGDRVKEVVSSSIKIALSASIICAICLFLSSGLISINLFHDPDLTLPLRSFAIAVPFLALIIILTSIFRGFDKVTPQLYFGSILQNALPVAFLGVIITMHLSFPYAIYAFVISIVVTCLTLVVYTYKRSPASHSSPMAREKSTPSILPSLFNVFKKGIRISDASKVKPLEKELLLFSLPLLGTHFLWMIMTRIDTLMLGYFKTSAVVGLYNAAVPLAAFLPLFLNSLNFLYLPHMARLYAENQTEELRRTYQVIARWVFMSTLPIFLILVLFPDTLLGFLFGARYLGAAPALQVLALGYFSHSCLGGISNNTLVPMGRTRFIMLSTLTAVGVNIPLNMLLIPRLGILGAAIATASSLVINDMMLAVKLYSTSKMQPFTSNYVKPIAASLIPIFMIYVLAQNFTGTISFWLLPLFFTGFLAVYGLAALFTRSVDREDIDMFLTIEKRLGLNLSAIKNILRRFIR